MRDILPILYLNSIFTTIYKNEDHITTFNSTNSKIEAVITSTSYENMSTETFATAIAIAHRKLDFDGYVALGCIIRGETTHYDTVCNDSSRALQLLGLQGACIGNGILNVENLNQAEDRSDVSKQNKGGGAALAALHLIALSQKWGKPKGNVGFLTIDEISKT